MKKKKKEINILHLKILRFHLYFYHAQIKISEETIQSTLISLYHVFHSSAATSGRTSKALGTFLSFGILTFDIHAPIFFKRHDLPLLSLITTVSLKRGFLRRWYIACPRVPCVYARFTRVLACTYV